MKKLYFILVAVLSTAIVFAGNPDRAGETGAGELLINPWGVSSGMFGINTASSVGIEATRTNAAGIADIQGIEFQAANTQWLLGSGVSVSSLGFGTSVGEGGIVISGTVVTMGDIDITRADDPDGNLGTFSPSLINVGFGYGRKFSQSIYGGVVLRGIYHDVADASAFGLAFDAGIQYTTGATDNIHFGVSVRNIGTSLTYRGQGFTFRAEAPQGDFDQTQSQRSQSAELPGMLNIGLGYDIRIGEKLFADNEESNETKHRLSIHGNFTSNAVGKDHFGLASEYALKEAFFVRLGYRYEEGIIGEFGESRTNAHTGLSAGIGVDIMGFLDKPDQSVAVNYAYRHSNPFKGSHTLGLSFRF